NKGKLAMRCALFFIASLVAGLALPMSCFALDGPATKAPRDDKADDEMPRIPFANWVTLATFGSPNGRRAAARILANYPRRGMPTLLKLLGDRDGGVRLEALRSIEAVVSGISSLALYGADEPSMVLSPHSGLRRGPAWGGKGYKRIVGPFAEQLKKQLKKLEREGPELRSLAAETLRQLEARLAAAAVALKPGKGKVLTADPKGRAKVTGPKSGVRHLTDRQGNRLAKLTRNKNE